MEDTLGGWMEQFHSLLTYDNAALPESVPDKESVLDAAKAAVCANINLFLELNDEEFAPFVETFVQDVWTQLVTVTLKPAQVLRCLFAACCAACAGPLYGAACSELRCRHDDACSEHTCNVKLACQ